MASENDKTTSSSDQAADASSKAADAGAEKSGADQSGAAKAGPDKAGARPKSVTIDLEAKEVRNEAAEAAKAAAAKKAAGQDASKAADAGKDADKTASATDPKKSDAETAAKPGSKTAGKTDSKKDSKAAASAAGGGMGRQILAAAIGGGIALGGAFVFGQFSGGRGVEGALDDLQLTLGDTDARFRQLEAQLTELKKVEAGPSVSPSVVDALTARVEGLEGSAAAVADGAADDRQTTETMRADVTVLTEGLAEIRRFVSSGSAGESAAVASLSETVEGLRGDVAGMKTTMDGDVLERLAKLEGGAGRDDALREALAGVEERIATLDGRINSAAEAAGAAAKAVTEGDTVTGSSISALGERVDTLGKAVSEADKEATALDGRIVAGSMRFDTLSKNLEMLTAKVDGMFDRITEIETVVGGPGAREMASRAVAVSLLKNAVDSGRPFATEIAAVRMALPKDADLSALELSASTGIAPTTRLIADFPNVARVMAGTLEKVETGNSVVDKFLNNARSMVSVRATGDVVGGGPMAAIGRMEARVREGDLDAALEIYETLPDGTQAAGKEWAAAARGRLSADSLVDEVTADVIKALAASDS